MRKFKKLLTALLSASMALSFSTVSAWAEDYTYTVTFYAGNQGTFANMDDLTVSGKGNPQISMEGDRITVSGLTQGDVISFDVNQGAVSLGEDSKYYVQGLRLSGRDNDEQMEEPAFWVTGDEDYVVAYGIQGDMTSYTVNYVDENGNELAPSRTYYGNVGDKPVVAYRYVDGYIPQSLALTKTLSANEAENIFTFVYTQGDPDTIVRTETETTVVTGEPSVITVVAGAPAAAGTAAGGTAAGAAGGTGTGGAADAGDGAAAGEVADGGTETVEEEPVPEGTQDIVDLDEEETPLGDLEIEDNTGASAEGLSMVGSVAVAAAAGVILICLIVYLMKKRRSGSDETEE